jgi:hypothetical protein
MKPTIEAFLDKWWKWRDADGTADMRRDILKLLREADRPSSALRYALDNGKEKQRKAMTAILGVGGHDEPEQALMRERKRAEKSESELRNILALIHRDGGHHTASVGLQQSVADATIAWGIVLTERDTALSENERLRKTIQRYIMVAAAHECDSYSDSWTDDTWRESDTGELRHGSGDNVSKCESYTLREAVDAGHITMPTFTPCVHKWYGDGCEKCAEEPKP